MIAYVLHGKRDLRAEERPTPEAEPDEVLVQVRRAGICGSDVHYFATGHCGAFVPRRPFVLGHEVTGEIVAVGTSVTGLEEGMRVAVDPSRPCRTCALCVSGRSNLCPDMRYLGSASTDPHVDGAFASYVAVPASGCHVLDEGIEDAEAAMLEPLSVATHAVRRAGTIEGKSVLVTGAGTMGQLLVLVARAMGARRIAVTDRRQPALDLAAALGADDVFAFDRAASFTGPADVAFEASGAPEALRLALDRAGRGATVVQLGTLPGDVELPAHLVMQKELQLVGSFRFAHVFADALELIASRKVDVRPVVSHTFGFGELVRAFDAALDEPGAFKIQVEA